MMKLQWNIAKSVKQVICLSTVVIFGCLPFSLSAQEAPPKPIIIYANPAQGLILELLRMVLQAEPLLFIPMERVL
jgi:hypothetical protein